MFEAVHHQRSGLSFAERNLRAEPGEWRALWYFSVYRLLLTGLIIGLALQGGGLITLGTSDPGLFRVVAIGYVAFSLFALGLNWLRLPNLPRQVAIQVLGDVIALIGLMHASGGVASGFGLLLVVAIAGASILSGGRQAILFAAVASLGVLAEQAYFEYQFPWLRPNYPQAGFLGIALFATAYLAHWSARRLRSSEALAARQEVVLADLARLNEHIVQRMQSGILVVEADGQVRLCNKSAGRLLGSGELPAGTRLGDALPSLAALLSSWRRGSIRSTELFEPEGSSLRIQVSFSELQGDRSDGSSLLFLEDYSAIGQRAQHLKLASLGRLAGSIAHEIRNPLSAVTHANALLQESVSLTDNDRRLMQIIDNNARRMDEIVESVLSLSRRTPSDPHPMQVNDWLTEFAEELINDADLRSEQVVIQVEPADLKIRADSTQIRQVLQNLCDNALQHATEQPARVCIEAGLAPESRRPYIEVSDNGPGIPAEALDKLFEPFFTTRVSGSGLGLYIARELCEANQATLNHRPTDSGCCFRMTFSDPRRRGAALV